MFEAFFCHPENKSLTTIFPISFLSFTNIILHSVVFFLLTQSVVFGSHLICLKYKLNYISSLTIAITLGSRWGVGNIAQKV